MRIALLAGALALTLAACGVAHADSSILTYKGSLDRAGHYVMPGLTYERARGLRPDPSFNATFRGQVYAQPLLWRDPGTGAGVLIVATEEDEVYAFDEKTGAQVWKRTLGEPVLLSAAFHCGNIWPLGVTGTPVIDPARATLYLDAAIMRDNKPRHEIYALSLVDGSIEPGWPVDVATAMRGRFDPTTQNQRGALALFGGKVFVPFGGLAGDCGQYHGMILGVSTTEPGKVASFSTRARSGGIWAPGGVSGDGKSLFAATGNTFFVKEWGDGEAVLRFAPDLAGPVAPRDYFAPSDWRDLDNGDLDLGGTAPLPLDVPSAKGVRKLILAIGKDGDAYLIDRDNLGGIGGQLARSPVAALRTTSAPAFWRDGDAVLVAVETAGANCPPDKPGKGLVVLKIRADPSPAIDTAWCANVASIHGSPIVTTTDGHSNPIVFALGAQGDSRLYAFQGDTGELLESQRNYVPGTKDFGTLIAADGRLYVTGGGKVYAFTF
jgi:putative pyrroloquinoline-quinone binding quinoprotein